MTFHPANKIPTRRKEIENEISAVLAHLESLRIELKDLDIAERVFARLYGPAESEAEEEGDASQTEDAKNRKPAGLPTVKQMIFELLAEARNANKPGLTPTDLTDLIQLKWWPGATSVIVGPGAWRLWKAGKLEKDEGGRYRLPQGSANVPAFETNEGPNAGASEPS